ncbi:MAG TPA: undecaprenyldiphospho-muramoylpentapeptide beta-N-acetylglucosaminyltransferase [Firmicutes bacterium]|nr:undecaprenyldiphospho-muramoylpentapeptide beta-N-acetylglucosaminyltransferase [Bacillota bacterium]
MRIILTGGGTGGHIYPALALARYIKKIDPAVEMLFVGASGGMEEKIIPPSGFSLSTLQVKGLPRRVNFSLFKAFYLLGKSSAQAKKIIEEFKPDYVIGTGGYAAAPIILAALACRVKVILHEQNVIPGITNRFLAPFVYRVCLSFAASQKYFLKQSNLCLTGNPRASEVGHISKSTARKILNMDPKLAFVLAVGGSQGAAKLNQCMLDFLFKASGEAGFQMLYITGERYYEKVISSLKDGNLLEIYGLRLKVLPYQREMALGLAAADLIVTRAGATTLAEITALGIPAIIIPSPNVVHNHQLINARELFSREAAVLIEENQLSGEVLKNNILSLLNDPRRLDLMKRKSKEIGFPEAAHNIYKLMTS